MPPPMSATVPNGKPSAPSVEVAHFGARDDPQDDPHVPLSRSRLIAQPPADVALSGTDLDGLFAGCEEVGPLLLAVSGGPDSMALMRLAARWAAAAGRPRLHVATVDHGLRRESAAEALFVAAAAARLGLPHATLDWIGPKPTTRRQERARTARYALLAGHARALGATRVLAAHHADDQAETVLMRLGRGSGLAGLRGMDRESPLAAGVMLVRPLLGLPKAALVAVCRQDGQDYLLDPSNGDPAFARVRLRRQAAAAEDLGLGRDGLLRLARRMARAEIALEAETARVERRLAPRLRFGEWEVRFHDPAGGPAPEILQRLLRRAIMHAANDGEACGGPCGDRRRLRLDRLETLADAFHAALAGGQALGATLGGTRIVLARDGSLKVIREPPRRCGHPSVQVKATRPQG